MGLVEQHAENFLGQQNSQDRSEATPEVTVGRGFLTAPGVFPLPGGSSFCVRCSLESCVPTSRWVVNVSDLFDVKANTYGGLCVTGCPARAIHPCERVGRQVRFLYTPPQGTGPEDHRLMWWLTESQVNSLSDPCLVCLCDTGDSVPCVFE